MVQFLKQHKNKIIWLLILGILIAGGIAYSQQGNGNGVKYDLVEVQLSTLAQSVSATGTLEPKATIDLSFQSSGLVKEILKDTGDTVHKGDILAILENSNEAAGLKQAKASLSEVNASLNLAVANATDEEITIARIEVEQADANLQKIGVDLDNARTTYENTQKTVAEQNRVADLQVKNAEVALKKVQSNSGTTSDQNESVLNNASFSLKNSVGQVLNAVSSSVVTVDKLFGNYDLDASHLLGDPTSYRGDAALLFISMGNNLRDVYAEQNRLSQIYYALSSTATTDEIESLSDDIELLVKNTHSMLVQVTDMSEFLYVDNLWLTQAELDAFKIEIRTTSGLFDTAAGSFDQAKAAFDKARLAVDGSDETLPLDNETAEVLLEQAESNRDKIQVDGDVQIDTAESQVKSLEAQYQVNEALVGKAQAQLDKVLASPRAVDLAPFKARVAQAAAQVDKAQSVLDKTLLKAPEDGVILNRDIEVGEQIVSGGVAAQKTTFQMMDNSDYHIDVDVPETQIAKISPESDVDVTFDGLDKDQHFEGRIVSVEPGPTIIQDVVYYKVKVALVTKDERLKPGMTADVTIETESKENVLAIPERAITSLDGKKGVMIPDAKNNPVQKEIRTGVRGDEGMIEVIEGLKVGDMIFVPATL